jgi:hypothetical protein
MDEYYLSLGRFVDRFSDAEDHIFIALQNAANLNSRVGRALLSGTRVRTAIDFIKRVYEANDEALPPRLLEAFSQLAAINTARDQLLHSAVRMENNQLTATNLIRSHADRTLRALPISPAILQAMTTDLETIILILAVHLNLRERCADPSDTTGQAVLHVSQSPWRYIPSQSSTQGRQTQSTNRRRSSQPPASQG